MSWVGKQLCSSRSPAQGRSGTPCSQQRLPWVTAAPSGATHRVLSLSQGAGDEGFTPGCPGRAQSPQPGQDERGRPGSHLDTVVWETPPSPFSSSPGWFCLPQGDVAAPGTAQVQEKGGN